MNKLFLKYLKQGKNILCFQTNFYFIKYKKNSFKKLFLKIIF